MGQAAVSNRRLDSPDDGPGSYDQARAELALLRQAVEHLQDGVAITAQTSENSPPRIVFANAAFQAMADCPGRCAFAENIDATRTNVATDDKPLGACLKESHRTDEVYAADIEHRGKDEATMLLHFRSEPLRDESGQITHRIAVFRDGTREAGLEEAARRNERLACIGLLAAGIAHEINNPLGSALLAAETALAVKDSPDACDRVTACLQNIVTSMDRCGRIVRTLLRYSRQEPSEKQACSINDVADQAVDLARPYAGSHGARLRLDIDPVIPLAPMNPLEIELVLLNLIRNAVEAGGGNVDIAVGTMSIEEGVRVEVRDNGCGMSNEQIAHVFDPLFTTRRDRGGSGLGMSIALGIVEAHQGHMEVTSQKGKGTTATIDLPVAAGSLKPGGNQGQNNHGSNTNR